MRKIFKNLVLPKLEKIPMTANDTNEDSTILICSFCSKSKSEKKKFIAGPGVFICESCVALCVDVIMEDSVVAEHFLNEVSVKSKQQLAGYDLPTTTREIQFSPEIRHAGITALSNFGEFVKDAYGDDENVVVSIQQEGAKIVLDIRGESGEFKDRIQETLYSGD